MADLYYVNKLVIDCVGWRFDLIKGSGFTVLKISEQFQGQSKPSLPLAPTLHGGINVSSVHVFGLAL